MTEQLHITFGKEGEARYSCSWLMMTENMFASARYGVVLGAVIMMVRILHTYCLRIPFSFCITRLSKMPC